MCGDFIFGISWYSVWLIIGVVACLFLYDFLCKKRKITFAANKFYNILGLAAIIVGFFFASLVQSIYNFIDTGEWNWAGITFMGGMFGGAITFVAGALIFAKGDVRAQFGRVCEIAAACIPTAHAFGRIGCFCAGCCYGKEVHEGDPFSFLAVTFKYDAGRGVPRYPTQLFEAVFLFLLAAVMIFLVLKDKRVNVAVYFLGYGLFRFLIEFLRADERGSIGVSLSPSQVLSIVCMAIGLLAVGYMLLKKFSPGNAEKIKALFKLNVEMQEGGETVAEETAENEGTNGENGSET
ncbi:MAG: prolipoprotein diacylglyceryl transferase [Clostridia bacterium]|nr:prolipoprotein diacylglyceryl transferase [Clostridia bacterium]